MLEHIFSLNKKIMAKVTIYTTPTCSYCKAAKDFFNNNEIGYIEKDVSANVTYREEMIQKTEQVGVPVIELDNELIVGFDEKRLRKIFKIF